MKSINGMMILQKAGGRSSGSICYGKIIENDIWIVFMEAFIFIPNMIWHIVEHKIESYVL